MIAFSLRVTENFLCQSKLFLREREELKLNQGSFVSKKLTLGKMFTLATIWLNGFTCLSHSVALYLSWRNGKKNTSTSNASPFKTLEEFQSGLTLKLLCLVFENRIMKSWQWILMKFNVKKMFNFPKLNTEFGVVYNNKWLITDYRI